MYAREKIYLLSDAWKFALNILSVSWNLFLETFVGKEFL
jgi:hypothetical protein